MKTRLLIAFAVIVAASAFMFERIPQDNAYHQFADGRTLFAVANFWNVVSNLPFVAVGAAGLWYLRQRRSAGLAASLYPAYAVFFIGVLATGFGSGWYHLAPDNNTLVWDRLPMTIAFMGFFAIVIGEQVCDKSARRLLIPLLLVGAASVFYWRYTEAAGVGDLRPYALVQFLPMLLIPVMLISYPSLPGKAPVYWGVLALYGASKLLEFYDYPIFAAGGILSGHSLKHLAAAAATWVFLRGLLQQERENNHV